MWVPDTKTDHYITLGEQGREHPALSLVAEGAADKGTPEEVAFELTFEGRMRVFHAKAWWKGRRKRKYELQKQYAKSREE